MTLNRQNVYSIIGKEKAVYQPSAHVKFNDLFVLIQTEIGIWQLGYIIDWT